MSIFTFDEATHTYTLDGRRLPSVTQIIAPLHDFSRVPLDVLERKRAFGVAVHLACELDDNGELDDAETDADVLVRVEAWRKFKRDTGATVLMNEQRFYHPSLLFAGTLDRVIATRAGDVYMPDLKTSTDMADAFGVQLSGYELLVSANRPEYQRIARKGLQLRDDGTYRLIPYNDPNDMPCFMGLLAVHRWKESHS